jgi:hypothetical protein
LRKVGRGSRVRLGELFEGLFRKHVKSRGWKAMSGDFDMRREALLRFVVMFVEAVVYLSR